MSNIVALDKFKRGPSAVFADVASTGSLSDGIGQSFGILSYKGKVWRLRYRGRIHTFMDPPVPGRQQRTANAIKVAILRDPGHKAKQFYGEFKEGEHKPPRCSSLDGITPLPDVPEPQAEACAMCPRNEGKRDHTGRWSKECKDLKRLAVLLDTENILDPPFPPGTALLEPVLLPVPSGSLGNLAAMGKEMEDMGHRYFTFLTTAEFDEKEAYPKMVFKAVDGPLEDAEAAVVRKLMESPDTLRVTGEESYRGGPRQVPIQVAAPPPPKRVGFAAAKPVQIEVAPEPDAPRIQTTAFSDAKPVTIEHAPVSTPVVDEELPPVDPSLDATVAQMINAVKGT